MEGNVFVKQLKEHKKQLVTYLTNQKFTPHDILSILKERDENNVSTLKTIYNARSSFARPEITEVLQCMFVYSTSIFVNSI